MATWAISSPRWQSGGLEPLGQRRAELAGGGGEAGELLEEGSDQHVGVAGHRLVGAPVEIDREANERLLGVDVGADVDGGRNDLHGGSCPRGGMRPTLVPPEGGIRKGDCARGWSCADRMAPINRGEGSAGRVPACPRAMRNPAEGFGSIERERRQRFTAARALWNAYGMDMESVWQVKQSGLNR